MGSPFVFVSIERVFYGRDVVTALYQEGDDEVDEDYDDDTQVTL
jgi:hypothetical protein